MELFQEYREKAKRNIINADHMLCVTYPLVKDLRLLPAILDNIFQAYQNAMSAALYHGKLFKTVPNFNESFEGKLNMFKDKIASEYGIDGSYMADIQSLKEFINQHKKSPMAFVRKDKFVICNDGYEMKAVGLPDIHNYLNKAKVFIQLMDKLTSKDERIFR